MRYLYLILVLTLVSCTKKGDYSCRCEEINNKYAQRWFGHHDMANVTEDEAEEFCKQMDSEMTDLYKDSLMAIDGYQTGDSARVTDVNCYIKKYE